MAEISHIEVGGSSYDIVGGIHYGEVNSTSTSTVFTATIDTIKQYYDGLAVVLRNGAVTSASGFTININGLGAKPVYNNMATGNSITPTAPTRETTIFNINYTLMLIYNSTLVEGGCWINYRGYNANDNTIGYQLRTNSTTMPVSDTARYYKIYFTSADGLQWVPASVNSTNNATTARPVNQRPINPFGRIVYTSASTSFTAGANLTAASTWSQYNLTFGYSFNRTGAALTLTSTDPVYIKCAPQPDGSAIIDADTPYVQALPTSADGKIYIFLGIATSATAVEMFVYHPVYYHDGTGIKFWTGTKIPTKTSELANDSGFITDADIPEGASKYTLTPANVATAAVVGTSNAFAPGDHVHGITGNTITSALGYTPYNSTNPNGYTTNTGTVTAVKINGTSKSPSNGVVDIGTVLTTYTETDPVFSGSAAAGITAADITNWNSKTNNTGTVTKITAGTGLKIGTATSGGDITSTGTINHINSITAQTTQALYPIKYDAQGHITDAGSAVTSLPASDVSAWAKAANKPSYTFSEIGSKPTTISGYGITDVYTKTQVDGLVSGVLHYKGTKATVSALPSTGNVTGDVWHVTADGSEHAWDGTAWQELGTAVDLSNYVTHGSTDSSTTDITISDHSTTTITGVQASTTSVTGVQASTTTASKVTLGTAISVPNVTSAGSASSWTFENITVPVKATSATTVPIKATSATTVPIKNASATSIPNVTAVGSGSYTQGAFTGGSFTQGEDSFTPNSPTVIDTTKFSGGSYSHSGFSGGSFSRGTFSGGSLTMTMDTTDTKQLNIAFSAATHAADSFTPASYGTDSFTPAALASGFYTAGTAASFTQGEDSFTPATHAADSHTHVPPTLGTEISIIGVQSSTTSVTGVQSSTTSVTGVQASTVTASHVTGGGNGTAPSLGTAISIPNVSGVTDVTVPIKATAATTVPIKNTSTTTVVTSKTHTVNDSGHTHTI